MDVSEAYKIVYKDILDQPIRLFLEHYDAYNAKDSFMHGVSAVMEYMAYKVSDVTGNMIKSEKKAEEKIKKEQKDMDDVYIWQLPGSSKRAFKPIDYSEVRLADYVLVYSFKQKFEKFLESDLEDIYDKFNNSDRMPDDYYARSLSVGDLIMVAKDADHINYYMVDIQGFTKVKAFTGKNYIESKDTELD